MRIGIASYKGSILSGILAFGAWGFVIVAGSFLSFWLGLMIDKQLRTEPYFMLGLFFLAIMFIVGRLWRKAMEMTDTLALASRDMESLSGGERQRVLIARALAQEPRLMLLDEPTAFLDIRHQVDFFDRIRLLNRKRELTVIAVTHDINLAAHYCDRIILLKNGRIEAAGPVEAVITEEHIREAYETRILVDRHPGTGSPRITLT